MSGTDARSGEGPMESKFTLAGQNSGIRGRVNPWGNVRSSLNANRAAAEAQLAIAKVQAEAQARMHAATLEGAIKLTELGNAHEINKIAENRKTSIYEQAQSNTDINGILDKFAANPELGQIEYETTQGAKIRTAKKENKPQEVTSEDSEDGNFE